MTTFLEGIFPDLTDLIFGQNKKRKKQNVQPKRTFTINLKGLDLDSIIMKEIWLMEKLLEHKRDQKFLQTQNLRTEKNWMALVSIIKILNVGVGGTIWGDSKNQFHDFLKSSGFAWVCTHQNFRKLYILIMILATISSRLNNYALRYRQKLQVT